MAGSEEDPGKQYEASAGTAGRTTFQRACAVAAETEARAPVLHEQVLMLHDGRERFGLARRPPTRAPSISSSDWAGRLTIPELRMGKSVSLDIPFIETGQESFTKKRGRAS